MSKYRIESKIKRDLKAAGLVIRDLAYALNEAPTTTGNRLNGYLPFTSHHRKTARSLIKSRIKTHQ